MNNELIKILLVEMGAEDQAQFLSMIEIENLPYQCIIAGSVADAKALIKRERFDIIITEYALTEGTALEIIDIAIDYPVIVATRSGNIETSVNVVKAGASDYIVKDVHYNYIKLLPTTIERALKDYAQEKMLNIIEQAAENTNETMIILEPTPVDHPGRKILYVNKAFCNMTGYTNDEVIGKTLNIFYGVNTDTKELEKARIAFETNTPITIEVANYKKDGAEFWVESHIVPFKNENIMVESHSLVDKAWFIHWVSMDRDVTKKREYEEALKTAINAAKEAAQLKSDFLSSVSHELRTPLTSILGFTVLVKESLNDYIFPNIVEPEKKLIKKMKNVSEALDIMEQESTRLSALINDVLDIAKIEAGKIEWQQDEVDIVEVFNEALKTKLQMIKDKGLELISEIIGEDFIIIGDKGRLIQAVSNIINNAIKFTDSGGITYKIKRDLSEIRCYVSDTGIGIPSNMVGSVFEKFKQIGNVLTDKPKGTGLGLPICKVIIEHHGGRIWAESKEGQGSNFIFTIPLHYNIKKSELIDVIKDAGRF